MKSVIINLMLLYMSLILFYGLIIKITINNLFLFKLKTIMPEMILVCIIIIGIIRTLKEKGTHFKNKYMTMLVLYIIFVITANIFMITSIDEALFIFRDFIIPIFVFYILIQIDFNRNDITKFFEKFNKLLVIFVITGFLLGILQHFMGWEWTSNFYTGYQFYGLDELSKVKIWHANKYLRVPSITGNSATFGFYNLIAFVFIINSKENLKYRKIYASISVLNIFISTSKTPLIIALILIISKCTYNIKKEIKLAIVQLCLIMSIIFLIITIKYNPGILFSLQERIKFWKQSFHLISPITLLVPINLFQLTPISGNILSFIDNTYLYFLYSVGFVGLTMILGNIYIYYKNIIAYGYDNIARYIIIIFLISSLFLNVTQGRCYWSIFCMLLPICMQQIIYFGNKKER